MGIANDPEPLTDEKFDNERIVRQLDQQYVVMNECAKSLLHGMNTLTNLNTVYDSDPTEVRIIKAMNLETITTCLRHLSTILK